MPLSETDENFDIMALEHDDDDPDYVASKHSVYINTMKINTNVVFNKHRVCVQ